MLPSLPDECKQLLWCFFDATTLCRVACVARHVEQGVALMPLWKRLAVESARREIARVPVERVLQRQNATRRFELSDPRSSGDLASARGRWVARISRHRDDGEEDKHDGSLQHVVDAHFWREWYRDLHLAFRRFDTANAAFEEAKNELQELKKQRSQLRQLLQATVSKSQSDKQLRRMQMNCIRWLNRTSRRAAAATQARSSQTTALTKHEITDQIQSIDSAIQWQSRMIFSLRSQYQKAMHTLTIEVARGKRVLADLDDD